LASLSNVHQGTVTRLVGASPGISLQPGYLLIETLEPQVHVAAEIASLSVGIVPSITRFLAHLGGAFPSRIPNVFGCRIRVVGSFLTVARAASKRCNHQYRRRSASDLPHVSSSWSLACGNTPENSVRQERLW